MQRRSEFTVFFVAVIAVALGEPLFDKLHPNRDERFQIKNAEFQSIGCWKDSLDLKALLPLENKHPLLMDGHGEARSNALMKCAEAAWDLGLKIFAVQNGGECMGEHDGERKYMKYGMSNLCHGDGLGGPYVNEVYRFLGNHIVPQDGSYSDWQAWGGCSASCGPGTETRIRTCTDPAPYGGGKDCAKLGPASQSRKCNVANC
ncbi:uncharacterized protein LOC114523594 [Dendronephthya gigantea]|uniref:uncharacterized protein LOC114523594 n=1 Tax=Dendronephthya gigantea TaxID=151771 RepID=UPI00106B23D8|nr:uncharacterized protein LOC114523594 [Dendronephthya gigantea]